MNLLEAAAKFVAVGVAYEANIHGALEQACVIIQDEAQMVLGSYEYGWTPLQPETIARKANGDTPLLETGDMRDSIEHTVVGKSGFIGSNSDIAVYQELGTSRIPPRSFLGQAAAHKGEEASQAIGAKLFYDGDVSLRLPRQ